MHHARLTNEQAAVHDSAGLAQLGADVNLTPPGCFPATPEAGRTVVERGESGCDARAREVIDEELRDAGPEERDIWHDVLRRHSPETTREILSLRRLLAASQDLQPEFTGATISSRFDFDPGDRPFAARPVRLQSSER